MRLILVTDDQFDTITSALTWYADDRRECARTEHYSEADAANHDREADEAEALREKLDLPVGHILREQADHQRKLRAVADAALAMHGAAFKVTTGKQLHALQALGNALVDYNGAPLAYRGPLNPEAEVYVEPAQEG